MERFSRAVHGAPCTSYWLIAFALQRAGKVGRTPTGEQSILAAGAMHSPEHARALVSFTGKSLQVVVLVLTQAFKYMCVITDICIHMYVQVVYMHVYVCI